MPTMWRYDAINRKPHGKLIYFFISRQMNQIDNIELTCIECNDIFYWTVGEQEFMAKLEADGKIKKVIKPKRCAACRRAKKLNNN